MMSESNQHLRLVRLILAFIEKEFAGVEALTLFDDTAEPIRRERPPRINGHVPDVYAVDVPPTMAIIGEAKTQRDLETDRSRKQIGCFLDHLVAQRNGVFVLAVPLEAAMTARGLVGALLRERPSASTRFVLLDGMSS